MTLGQTKIETVVKTLMFLLTQQHIQTSIQISRKKFFTLMPPNMYEATPFFYQSLNIYLELHNIICY